MFSSVRLKILSLLLIILLSNYVILTFAIITNENNFVIHTSSGPIRGYRAESLKSHKPYYAFQGVPYAEPPLNELRFKAPVAHRNWTDVLDTFQFGAECMQIDRDTGKIVGNENCLYLNVYVPVTVSEHEHEKLPVMVFIHGGGFQFGSGDNKLHGPDFIIDQHVILVTINYRLNIFGFLSLDSSDYSGNAGLKDQQFALKWINENIKHFGGDRNQITLTGHSAGSASVHYHILGHGSRQYFQRAVMMAISATTPTVFYEQNDHIEVCKSIAQANGVTLSSYKDVVDYLATAKPEDLMKLEYEIHWAPVAEGKHSLNPILRNSPGEYMQHQIDDIDVLIGFTVSEGLLFFGELSTNSKYMDEINTNFNILYTKIPSDSAGYQEAADKARELYFGENDISTDTAQEFIDMYSDLLISYVDEAVKSFVKNSNGNIFYYRLSAETSLNWHKSKLNIPSIIGATHGDEACYLFRCHIESNLYENTTENSDELRLIRQMTTLWTNFVKYGNPTPNGDPIDFKPVTRNEVNFVDISVDGLTPALNPNGKGVKFWQDLRKKYTAPINRHKIEL